jgi:hypothetical protein
VLTWPGTRARVDARYLKGRDSGPSRLSTELLEKELTKGRPRKSQAYTAIQLENGNRIFVNVSDSDVVEVVDRKRGSVVFSWRNSTTPSEGRAGSRRTTSPSLRYDAPLP